MACSLAQRSRAVAAQVPGMLVNQGTVVLAAQQPVLGGALCSGGPCAVVLRQNGLHLLW